MTAFGLSLFGRWSNGYCWKDCVLFGDEALSRRLISESAAGGLGQQHGILRVETLRETGRNDKNDSSWTRLSGDPHRRVGYRHWKNARFHWQRIHEPRAQREHSLALRSSAARAQHAPANWQQYGKNQSLVNSFLAQNWNAIGFRLTIDRKSLKRFFFFSFFPLNKWKRKRWRRRVRE